jgi:GNAT superfamily N-acetyltransferase
VTVIDEYQGLGVGSRLMDALLVLARKRGVRRILADVLRENVPCAPDQPLSRRRAAQRRPAGGALPSGRVRRSSPGSGSDRVAPDMLFQ